MEIKANECLIVSTSGSGGFNSAKLIVSENSDTTIDATMNYYTDNACSVGIKTTSSQLSGQTQNECVASTTIFDYTSTLTPPTDGVFTGIYAGNCDTAIYAKDSGLYWGTCISGVKYNGCTDTTTLSATSYFNADCSGTGIIFSPCPKSNPSFRRVRCQRLPAAACAAFDSEHDENCFIFGFDYHKREKIKNHKLSEICNYLRYTR